MSFYDPQEHGGVTDEALEEFFNEHPDLKPLASVGEGESETGDDGDNGTPTPPAPAPEVPPTEPPDGAPSEPESDEGTGTLPPSGSDFYEVDGESIPRSQLEAAARFQRHLAQDANLQQVIRAYLTGDGTAVASGGSSVPPGAPPATAPAPAPVIPEGLDLEDPSIRALYGVLQQQQQQLEMFQRGLNVTASQQTRSFQQQAQSQWATASESFAKDHDLGPDDIKLLGEVAARLNVLPSLMQPFDPVSGMPTNPDAIHAFKEALEIAYYKIPEYRDRAFRKSVETMQSQAKKQKLLGAVGGSSGSVSRTQTPPSPGTRESKQEMVREVASMLSGDWTDPVSN